MANDLLDEMRSCTASNIFLVPLLGIPRPQLNEVGYVNSYVADTVRNIDYERGLYLLFKPNDLEKLEDFLANERKRGSTIIDEYDYPPFHTMVVYQYAAKWKKDVEILMTGKFSGVSKEFQNAIPKYRPRVVNNVTKQVLTLQHSIFKKDPEFIAYWWHELGLDINYKEDEVWPFYAEREIFTEKTLSTL